MLDRRPGRRVFEHCDAPGTVGPEVQPRGAVQRGRVPGQVRSERAGGQTHQLEAINFNCGKSIGRNGFVGDSKISSNCPKSAAAVPQMTKYSSDHMDADQMLSDMPEGSAWAEGDSNDDFPEASGSGHGPGT